MQIQNCESDQRAHPHPQHNSKQRVCSEFHFGQKKNLPNRPWQRGGSEPLPRPLWGTASQSTMEIAKSERSTNSDGSLDGALQKCVQGDQKRCKDTLMEPRPEIAEDTLVQSNVQKNELSTNVYSAPQESAVEEESLRVCRVGTTYAYEIEEEKSHVNFIPRRKYRIQAIIDH